MAGGSLGTGSVTIQNIIAGPGNLYYAAAGTALPTWATDANSDLVADANWTHVGATMEGVEVGYSADFGEIIVDQLKGPAKLFNQGATLTMGTQLAEVTLGNLALAWGQDGSEVISTSGTTDTFSICVPDDNPYEFQVVVVGEGPPQDGDSTVRERIYLARRVIAVEGSTHSLRRTDATMFPVSFRCLPDPAFVGSEYGQIIDRVAGA